MRSSRSTIEHRVGDAMAVYRACQQRLGERFFEELPGDVAFEFTAQGRVMLQVGELRLFLDDDDLVIGRPRGGRVEWCVVDPDGQGAAFVSPSSDPSMN